MRVIGFIGSIFGSIGATLGLFGSIFLILAAWIVPALSGLGTTTSKVSTGPEYGLIVLGSLGVVLALVGGAGTAIAHPSQESDEYHAGFSEGWLEFIFFLVAGLWRSLGGVIVETPRPLLGGILMTLSALGMAISTLLVESDLFDMRILWVPLILIVGGILTIGGGFLRTKVSAGRDP